MPRVVYTGRVPVDTSLFTIDCNFLRIAVNEICSTYDVQHAIQTRHLTVDLQSFMVVHGCLTMQVWDRRRHVPSQVYNDPLLHLFEEFDKDSDGHLTHMEIAEALQSNRYKSCFLLMLKLQRRLDSCQLMNLFVPMPLKISYMDSEYGSKVEYAFFAFYSSKVV